ncbi:hypothetical protein [Corallococcus exercitus]|uniref:hypothetical protein n=1 Tax=Corallococcus exercitus TaxID=2316736 RepID=UPI0035D4C851
MRDLSCTHDSDCLGSELCHPAAKVCVQTCESSADCPDTAKTCTALSATVLQKVCKCSTDALCNSNQGGSELVCSIPHDVCTPKCTTDAQCGTGEVCDTQTGHCKESGGSDPFCTGEGQSTCDYGTHSCRQGLCVALPAPTCLNYENFQDKDRLGTTGPILYDARMVGTTMDAAACGEATPKVVRVALSAYSSVPFPTTRDQLGGFFRVKVEGALLSGASQVFSGADYTVLGADRQRAEIIVSLCASSSSTTLSSAFYFTGGNFLCYQAHF